MPEDKEVKEAKKGTPNACGHQNKHFIPAIKDGKAVDSDKMVCNLEKGHAGDHQAVYKTVRGDTVVEAIANWSDAAGEPIK